MNLPLATAAVIATAAVVAAAAENVLMREWEHRIQDLYR